jgi:hypothetical protein
VGGYDLAALIFAREVSGPLTSLVKTIDKQLGESSARHKGPNKLGVFVVFCSDDPNLKQQLQNLIAKEGLKHIVLSLSKNNAQGPPRYRVAREADVTVAVYQNRRQVVANFVLDSEDLTADKIKDIMTSLRKVLP